MSYFVYILYSPTFNRTYAGQSDNLANKLSVHNSGKVKSTKPYLPWHLVHSETFDSRAEAMNREKWFKSTAGRKKLKEILQQYLSG